MFFFLIKSVLLQTKAILLNNENIVSLLHTADCLTPSEITGVTISSGSTIYQSTRTLQCQSGYQAEKTAVSTSTITCLESGEWSTPNDAFKCLKGMCI